MQDLEHAVDVASSIQTVRFHRDSTIAVPAVTQRSSSDAQLSYATFIPNLPVHDIPGIFIEKPGLLHILSNTIYWLNNFRPQAQV